LSEGEGTLTEHAAADGPGNLGSPHFQVLMMADFIRRRPGMYIGETGPTGLHVLAEVLLECALAEISFGGGTSIQVRLNADGSLSVADDGRGIPVGASPQAGMTTLEWVMTFGTWVEVRGGKRDFRTSLHGVGTRTVTALADWAEAVVCRDGRVCRQRYERGLAVGDVCDVGPAGGQTGTCVTFHPDPAIFANATFDRDRLEDRLRELAFLNKSLLTRLSNERSGREAKFRFPGGVVEFVGYLNRTAEVLHQPIFFERLTDDVKVEIAMQYTAGTEERVRCYANNAYNVAGGSHQCGLRSALTRALRHYGRREGLLTNGPVPSGEDFRSGLTAVVNVKVAEPFFESANKRRLNNPEVEGIVAGVVRTEVTRFLEENPREARRIVLKAVAAANARMTQGRS
jgi:DNA gyrase subunit B